MSNVLIGNVLSGFAAGFLIISGVLKRARAIYMSQCLESFFLLLAQIAFFQIGAAICLLVSILKNLLIVFGKYGRNAAISVFLLTLVLGVVCNTGGTVGLLPVAASLFFCIGSYFAKKCTAIKLTVAVNLLVWCIYSLLISDYVSLCINAVSFVLNISFVIRERRNTHDPQW